MLKNTFIIIVTFNAMPWISRCLKSCKTYNVIIVDNNSTDGTVQFIQENYPLITVIKQIENLGFGAANNIGISYALKQGAEYVFLLNQDAYLETNTLETLINIHKENKEYGIISPIHLNGNGTKLDLNFSHYLFKNKEMVFNAIKNKFTKTIYEVPFVNAAAWLLSKEILLNIGGFDPIFYHYGEDDNYCQRAIFHGFKIGIVPKVYVLHDREFRGYKQEISSKDKLLLKERYLKCKLANINSDIDKNIIIERKKIINQIIKLILRLKFDSANYFFKELNLINKILPVAKKSRFITKKTGKHYLEIIQ